MEKYLSELEIVKLETLCADEVMLEALRKVMLQGIYTHGVMAPGVVADPLKNAAYSLAAEAMNNPIPDELLGQHIRAQWAGLNALENAFRDLKKLKSKKDEPVESPYNEAE